jgi:ceramide glucosyltransferase
VLSFWLWLVCPAVLAALVSLHRGRRLLRYVRTFRCESGDMGDTANGTVPPFCPPTTLIVPVCGSECSLVANLLSLAELDYPNYELVIVARHSGDPGLQLARDALGKRARLIVSGAPHPNTGEKVHNLCVAIQHARKESEVFAFADSDGQVAHNWLRNLVAPLADERLGATTGFRWSLPENGGFWALVRSAWDSVIVGNMSIRDKNFSWGGATALRRSTFEKVQVHRYWQGTVSDDYRLSTALNKAGLGIRFIPSAMVASTSSCTAKEFFNWAGRQLVLTRIYRTRTWFIGLIGHVVYCAAILASCVVTLSGDLLLGTLSLLAIVAPGIAKGSLRRSMAYAMFPSRESWLVRNGWIYVWLVPICTWIWLTVFLRSAATSRITWRGYIYDLIDSERTDILQTPPPERTTQDST